jgi:Fe-S cluster biogenesis protein NfuA
MEFLFDSSEEDVRPVPAVEPDCRDGEEAEASEETEMEQAVRRALEDVRPALQMDGGDVDLVRVTEDGVVYVRLVGACAGCPMSQMTLSQGVERRIREAVPAVRKVIAV